MVDMANARELHSVLEVTAPGVELAYTGWHVPLVARGVARVDEQGLVEPGCQCRVEDSPA